MTLDEELKQFKENAASATHLMIIAQTKAGKTDYVAQAAIDGWEILYFDNDNGLATLLSVLESHPDAMRRVHYFAPIDMAKFIVEFIECKTSVRYDSIRRGSCNSANVTPGATVTEIFPTRIPRNVIVVLDSWTSFSLSSVTNKAKALSLDLLEIDKYGREVYGPTGFKALEVAKAIQASPFNWIVQAHPAVYEIKERPSGMVAESIKEKDLIVKDTWQIPQSTSGPNGFAIGKFFNQIGWLSVNAVGNRTLDFRVFKGRIGGGSGAAAGVGDPRTAYRFSTLFGRPPAIDSKPDKPWIIELSAADYKAQAAAAHANAPRLSTGGVIKPPVTPNPLAQLKPEGK